MTGQSRRGGGQALPEFALVVPILLLLVFALIDFSRMLFTYISLTNGSREIGRAISLSQMWVGHAATDTTTIVNAFNNLTVIAGPASGAQNFSLTPPGGAGTISCSNMTSSGCGMHLNINWSSNTITFDENGNLPSAAATGTATATFSGSAMPTLSTFGVTADGDYTAMMIVLEGVAVSQSIEGYLEVCPLPLTTSCGLNNLNIWDLAGGMLEIDTNYTFRYNPLFQNRLTGVVDVSFMRQISVLSTTTRTTAE